MNWPSLEAFLYMGGHGLYVWGSYVLTIGLLAAEAWFVLRRQRRAQQEGAR